MEKRRFIQRPQFNHLSVLNLKGKSIIPSPPPCIYEVLSPAVILLQVILFLESLVSVLRESVVEFVAVYLFCHSSEGEHDEHSTAGSPVVFESPSPSKRRCVANFLFLFFYFSLCINFFFLFSRRPTEKALYMAPVEQDHADVKTKYAFNSCCYLRLLSLPYLSKQPTTKIKPSKFTGERGPQTSRSSHAPAVAIKMEPVDMDEGLQKRLSSPIVITSSEEEDYTPKAKPTKGRNFPSSLTKQDFIRASKSVSLASKQTPGLTRLGKGKEVAAEAEERLVDLPGRNQPLSETTVYLEDM